MAARGIDTVDIGSNTPIARGDAGRNQGVRARLQRLGGHRPRTSTTGTTRPRGMGPWPRQPDLDVLRAPIDWTPTTADRRGVRPDHLRRLRGELLCTVDNTSNFARLDRPGQRSGLGYGRRRGDVRSTRDQRRWRPGYCQVGNHGSLVGIKAALTVSNVSGSTGLNVDDSIDATARSCDPRRRQHDLGLPTPRRSTGPRQALRPAG